ncbi:MAG: formylglycine-generating enzyme family protein [Thermodesulfobacteriota bacterium]|nr:formylglycine-generating enzyme family protein [Thermodesulfobacteriota bacterium]
MKRAIRRLSVLACAGICMMVGFSCAGNTPVETPENSPATIQNDLQMSFVFIPPGDFTMGSPAKEPGRFADEVRHKVLITKGYYLQTTEVTQGQWESVMFNNPSAFTKGGYNCPVENVSWNDVQAFIRKLNRQAGTHMYRLPTEAEWEYACRKGMDEGFVAGLLSSTHCISTDHVNYNGNYPLPGCPKGVYRETTLPVASFVPDSLGLFDMRGNVYEWCADRYGPYPGNKVMDPQGRSYGKYRVFRGGSWYSSARYCRAAYRGKEKADYKYHNLGFRLVKIPQ